MHSQEWQIRVFQLAFQIPFGHFFSKFQLFGPINCHHQVMRHKKSCLTWIDWVRGMDRPSMLWVIDEFYILDISTILLHPFLQPGLFHFAFEAFHHVCIFGVHRVKDYGFFEGLISCVEMQSVEQGDSYIVIVLSQLWALSPYLLLKDIRRWFPILILWDWVALFLDITVLVNIDVNFCQRAIYIEIWYGVLYVSFTLHLLYL